MPVVAADVDDLTVVRDHIPHVGCGVIRGRVDKGPGRASVIADRETAIRSDINAVGIPPVDADAERRRLFAACWNAEARGGSAAGRLCPGRAAVIADIDARLAGKPAIVERSGDHPFGVAPATPRHPK